MDVLRNIIIPASLVGLARALGAGLSPGGVGMFTTGLSLSGEAPATHFISSGLIGERFAECIADASTLHDACIAAGANVSLATCQALVTNSVVTDGTFEGSEEGPFQLMKRLNLQMV
jgi:hypothetical protein